MQQFSLSLRKKNNMVFLLLLLGFGLRIVNLDQSFWLDEAAQVIESSRSFLSQFDLSSDFHPPLFHLLLHFWMYFGKSEIYVRIVPLVLSLMSLLFTYKVAKELTDKHSALLAMFFITIAPYHIWYSQEARPYMLFVLTSIASLYYLIRKQWLMYSAVLILMLYSLYFAPFVIIGQMVALLIIDKKSFIRGLNAFIVAAIAFLPWLPSFIHQLDVGTSGTLMGWTGVVSVAVLKVIPLTFAKFVFGRGSIDNNIIYGLIILPVFSLFLYGMYHLWRQKKGRLLVIYFVSALLSAWIVSLFIPIIAPQRLIFLLPLFYIMVAFGLEKIQPLYLKQALLLTVVVISSAGLIDYYINPNVQREQWRQAVAFVESYHKPALAAFSFSEPFAPWLWYSHEQVKTISLAPNFIVTQENLNLVQQVVKGQQTVFYFHYLDELTDPYNLNKQFFIQSGFIETAIKDFPGVGFISIYEKVFAYN